MNVLRIEKKKSKNSLKFQNYKLQNYCLTVDDEESGSLHKSTEKKAANALTFIHRS